MMPGRTYSAGAEYRYGFNGQEKSTEIHSSSLTAEYWEYDSRLGRRWNMDIISKTYESPYSTLANNPVWLVDHNGADTTINGKVHKDLEEVVVTASMKGRFSPLVEERIKNDARLSLAGKTFIPKLFEMKVRDLRNFTSKAVAQSFGEMLLLSRYQREEIVLGDRMVRLINNDAEFQKFEKEALAILRTGVQSYTSPETVVLGGKRKNFFSLKTIQASTQLTWALRNVYITATVVHGNSTNGGLKVEYHIEDYFDLAPGNREAAYNIGAIVLGGLYHTAGQNSAPHVTVNWQKSYE